MPCILDSGDFFYIHCQKSYRFNIDTKSLIYLNESSEYQSLYNKFECVLERIKENAEIPIK
jgi:hypothetical protein